ncbi:hypothetical protein DAPPUDRAFT_240417 [Daphnia pulex]|uniref:Uncharacterized protein n=1 Tax=Daphnia pulex TaxID=6669 RepID=E9GBH9_DAPPU|nr:hypothetical protein DAPPUDRAFT_240417 [Daphnia pulex]|eukprot:EFX82960.1 hypothetical protein DAPPUDRAFT_240417 [Daphnia pulex]
MAASIHVEYYWCVLKRRIQTISSSSSGVQFISYSKLSKRRLMLNTFPWTDHIL